MRKSGVLELERASFFYFLFLKIVLIRVFFFLTLYCFHIGGLFTNIDFWVVRSILE